MKSCNFDIYTVAYNNLELIEYQYKLLNKNLTDNFNYIICDNSVTEKRVGIQQFANDNNIDYISIPLDLTTSLHCNESHSSALNWLFYNIIIHKDTKFFGFLDHDIFPLSSVSILNNIKDKNVYGARRDSYLGDSRWYLFPGFCFFNLDFIKNKKVDFAWSFDDGKMWGDTGATNWYNVYRDMDLFSLQEEEWLPAIIETRGDASYSYYNMTIQYIGDYWVHLGGGNNLMGNKYEYCMCMLNKLLEGNK